MIKKLKQTVRGFYDKPAMPTAIEFFNKINEIIELLNEIVVDVDGTKCVDGSKKPEPADPYAEQRKWIGCLVEYGNADDGFRYGILTNIEPRYSAYPFEIDNGRDATADCWLPSKTIFYKGGDNE